MSELLPTNQNVAPPSDEAIWDILHLPQVTANIRHMYKASHGLRQETAFAVYSNDGGYQASDLLVPTVSQEIDSRERFSITVTPLIRNEIASLGDLTRDELREARETGLSDHLAIQWANASAEYRPDEATMQKFEAILGSYDLDEKAKKALIEKIVERQVDKLAAPKLNVRSDIALLAHNHPMYGQYEDDTHSYEPSPVDLQLYAYVCKGSPQHLSAIISSNGRKHGLMLFGASSQATDKAGIANTYESLFESLETIPATGQAISLLGRAGCSAVFIPMRSDGTPETDAYEHIFEFADSLKK